MTRNYKFKTSAIVGICVTLGVFPWMMDSINIPKLLILVLGSGISFYVATRHLQFKDYFTRNSKMFALVLTSFFFMLVSALVNDQNFYLDLIGGWRRNNGILAYVAVIILFLATSLLSSIQLRQYLVKSLSFLGFIFGIYGWLQVLQSDPLSKLFPWYNQENVLALTLGNSNFASVFFAFTFAATIGYFLSLQNWNIFKILLLISLLNQWIIVRYLDTQGKILYAFAGCIILAIWLITSRNSTFRKLGSLWVLLSSALGSLAILALWGIGPFSSMLSNNIINLKDRYYHWIAAWEMMKQNPIFGVGIDSFGDFHRQYRLVESITLRGNAISSTDNAHNVFMQLGATVGVPFLLTYLLIVLYISYKGICSLRICDDKIIVGTLLVIWFSYILQSLISIDQLGLSVWAWIVGGAIFSIGNSESDFQVNSRKVVKKTNSNEILKLNSNKVSRLTIISLTLFSSILTLNSFLNDNDIFKKWKSFGTSLTEIQAKENAKSLINSAINSEHPKLRIYVANTLGRSGFLNEALYIAQSTANEFPRDFESWNLVASIHEFNGRPDLALKARKITVSLDPLNLEIKEKLRNDYTGKSKIED